MDAEICARRRAGGAAGHPREMRGRSDTCADVLCECDMELMRLAAETLEEVAEHD